MTFTCVSIQDAITELLTTPKGHAYLDKSCMVSTAAAKAESHLENTFWHYMRKTDYHAWYAAESQHKVGRFRLDALVQTGLRRVGIELDGKEFHQDPQADKARDCSIILDGFVDEIIRIPFAAMTYASHATFKVLATWHPGLAIRSPPDVYSHENAKAILRELDTYEFRDDHDDAIQCADSSAEVYDVVSDGLAWALPFDAWHYRYRASPITRTTREMRGIRQFDDEPIENQLSRANSERFQ